MKSKREEKEAKEKGRDEHISREASADSSSKSPPGAGSSFKPSSRPAAPSPPKSPSPAGGGTNSKPGSPGSAESSNAGSSPPKVPPLRIVISTSFLSAAPISGPGFVSGPAGGLSQSSSSAPNGGETSKVSSSVSSSSSATSSTSSKNLPYIVSSSTTVGSNLEEVVTSDGDTASPLNASSTSASTSAATSLGRVTRSRQRVAQQQQQKEQTPTKYEKHPESQKEDFERQTSSPVSTSSKDSSGEPTGRERERDRDRDRDKDKERDRDRDKERGQTSDKEKEKEKEKDHPRKRKLKNKQTLNQPLPPQFNRQQPADQEDDNVSTSSSTSSGVGGDRVTTGGGGGGSTGGGGNCGPAAASTSGPGPGSGGLVLEGAGNVPQQSKEFQMPSYNSYQMYLNIRKQVDKRRRLMYPVQPKAPQGFKNFLLNSGSYLLQGRVNQPNHNNNSNAVNSNGNGTRSGSENNTLIPGMNSPPQCLKPGTGLFALFVDQEKGRQKLRIQHVIEKEKLRLSAELEVLRVHGRAALAMANQSVPFSVCTILKDEEIYNVIDPETESAASDTTSGNGSTGSERGLTASGSSSKNEYQRSTYSSSNASNSADLVALTGNPGGPGARSRYNGRLFISWLQDLDDKWDKIKEATLLRHRREAESLFAIQKLDWEWKMKELSLCDVKSSPRIEDSCVPMIAVNDDLELMPS